MKGHAGFGWRGRVIGILLIGLGFLTSARPELVLTSLVFF